MVSQGLRTRKSLRINTYWLAPSMLEVRPTEVFHSPSCSANTVCFSPSFDTDLQANEGAWQCRKSTCNLCPATVATIDHIEQKHAHNTIDNICKVFYRVRSDTKRSTGSSPSILQAANQSHAQVDGESQAAMLSHVAQVSLPC